MIGHDAVHAVGVKTRYGYVATLPLKVKVCWLTVPGTALQSMGL